MNFLKFLCTTLLFTASYYCQSKIINDNGIYYFADELIVKYDKSLNQLSKSAQELFPNLNIIQNEPILKNSSAKNINENELKNIYSIKFSSPYNPIYLAKELKKLDFIEWIEPHYLYEVVYDPNDPLFSDPDSLRYLHLEVIKAREAWDINKGSEDIVIAIIDTGVDWDHPDLEDNMWKNSGEIENNGIDDDGNGYIDDFIGWDFGGFDGLPDNDPAEDRADHGTHVAGLASAVTDNQLGIASIGFNSSLMAVKTSQDDIRSDFGTALIAHGYEGIVYAADNGAKIINCSWGGYNYSYTLQEVIDYAVSKGALVVAAAGNDNVSRKFYPASYDGVLSVGGTSFVDQKASWSNYGNGIDVTAPGVNIYSTWQSEFLYRSNSGTSMSSPIVAGLAALVTNQFPAYSPLQVGEQIRATTDNIDNINLTFQNKLGSGRINAFAALTTENTKSVRISGVEFTELGDNDGIFESGENVKIKLNLYNFLSPIANLTVELSSSDNNISIIKPGGSVGSIGTLTEQQTSNELIEISIKENAADNIDINILVTFTDNSYVDHDWITLSINPTYQIQTTENISLTFNSSGSIGFDDYPSNQKGNGFIYKDGPNLIFEGALMYGTSVKTITNVARNADGNKDNDFTVITPISQNSPGDFADKESYTKFSDELASPTSLGIETEVYTFSFSDELHDDYMFIRYAFTNTTNQPMTNFFTGQYWDFDLDNNSYEDDMVAYDSSNGFGYLFDDDGDPVTTHIGFALLSEGNMGFFAMDNDGTSNPTISWDGFSDSEKWTALTSGVSYPTSGPSDISTLISAGPYTLEPNVKLEIDFMVAAGDNLSDLTDNISNAKSKYSEIPTDIENEALINDVYRLEQNYPNPFNPATKIQYSIPVAALSSAEVQHVKLSVYDVLGREIATLISERQKPGKYSVTWDASNYPSGIYFYQLKTNSFSEIKKMVLLK